MVLKRIVNFIRDAGAYREADSERDGFLSYAAETHAVGYGLGLGGAVALSMAGVPFVLELMVAALGGVAAKRRLGNERVWREITDEPQYFLAAFMLGFIVVGGFAVAFGTIPL